MLINLEDRFLVGLIVSISRIELCVMVLIAPLVAIYESLKMSLLNQTIGF